MAAIHQIPVESVPGIVLADVLALYRDRLDSLGEPHPAFELAFRWIFERRASISGAVPDLVHGETGWGTSSSTTTALPP
jgi:hypothetical protein